MSSKLARLQRSQAVAAETAKKEAAKRNAAAEALASAAVAPAGPAKIPRDLLASAEWRGMEAKIPEARAANNSFYTLTIKSVEDDADGHRYYTAPLVTHREESPYTAATEVSQEKQVRIRLLPSLEANKRISALFGVGSKVVMQESVFTGELIENPEFKKYGDWKEEARGRRKIERTLPVKGDFIVALAPEDFPLLREQVRGYLTAKNHRAEDMARIRAEAARVSAEEKKMHSMWAETRAAAAAEKKAAMASAAAGGGS